MAYHGITLDVPRGPKTLEIPLEVPSKTLMGAGPTNCSQRVLDAMSLPVMGHLQGETLKIMDDVKLGIQYMFQTQNPLTLAVTAAGHGGMEAVLCNLLEDGEVALFAVSGIWGSRAAEIGRRYGADCRYIESDLGAGLTLYKIKAALEKHRPVVFFVTQGDSSTGVLQKIEGLGQLCHSYNCLLVVDTVASLGGVPMLADQWGVDAIYTGSQKVLGASPGITPISFSPRAQEKIFNRRTSVKVYYWDMTQLGLYWDCFPNQQRIYHHTISSTLLCGLREALAMACEEGLLNLWQRHQAAAERLYKGLVANSYELFVPNAAERLPTITTIKIPAGVDWKAAKDYAMKHYSVEIAGGLGPAIGKVFRIGLMGPNATEEKVDFVLRVFSEAVQHATLAKM